MRFNMNSKVNRFCAVPQCLNTSKLTPSKLFVYVPNKKTIRFKWLRLARRDPTSVSLNSTIHFCEDHFDLPNDMANFMEYNVMGSVSQVRMKPGCIPTKFMCQPDRTSDTLERPFILKKRRKILIQACEKVLEEKSVTTKHLETEKLGETSSGSSVFHASIENTTQIRARKTADKCIQVYITHKFRSKAIQTDVKQTKSPSRPNRQSVFSSPSKVKRYTTATTPWTPNKPSKTFCTEDLSHRDFSYTPSITHKESSPLVLSPQMRSSSDCSESINDESINDELIYDDKKQDALKVLEYTMVKIMKDPHSYIGVPNNCYHLLDLVEQNTSIPLNHIVMCLKKIKLNSSFKRLADDFSMTATFAGKIFLKNIPIIANVLRPFIVKLEKDDLPMMIKHNYHHVSCIIDCLEIEVEKPSTALSQSLLRSEHQKTNTIKYLVSCKPNGLVNYISPGYGGRMTDTGLVETSDFIKCLQPGMCVIADRRFKNAEQYLHKQRVQLLVPASVTAGTKLSKSKARETKQIASLRIHVERVIRRLQEFSMLKQHARLNHNSVKILDDVITIACGLINLQVK